MPQRVAMSSGALSDHQHKALVSPVRIEMIECLLRDGPSSVADLAERLGRAPDSLYYHVRLLVEAGILRESRSGVRGEAVFETTSSSFRTRCDPKSLESLKTERASLGAVLRLTERTYARALERETVRTHGKRRDLDAKRIRANLSAEARLELNRRVDELFDFLREQSTNSRGRATSVTLVYCPIEKD